MWHVVSVIDFPHEEEELMFLGNSSTHFRQVATPESGAKQNPTVHARHLIASSFCFLVVVYDDISNYNASNRAFKSGKASISASSSSVEILSSVPSFFGGALLGASNPTICVSNSTPNSAKT